MPPPPQPIIAYNVFPAVDWTGLLATDLSSWPWGHGGRAGGSRAARQQTTRRNIVEDPTLTWLRARRGPWGPWLDINHDAWVRNRGPVGGRDPQISPSGARPPGISGAAHGDWTRALGPVARLHGGSLSTA